ncbi:MAG: hypothetical protein JO061_23825, partial [Acidobacteriaceae bacterium]|nr:hypothetical protein [Acidobacteriaceae bacterium]
MTELFRYIQQAYALPETTGSIDTSSTNSSFQNELRQAISQNESPDQIRSLAGKFLDSQFPAGSTNPIGSSDQLLSFSRQLLALPDP